MKLKNISQKLLMPVTMLKNHRVTSFSLTFTEHLQTMIRKGPTNIINPMGKLMPTIKHTWEKPFPVIFTDSVSISIIKTGMPI